MEKLLDVKELAEILNVSPGTVYHWVSQGRLPTVHFSKRCVRFRESEIEKHLCDLRQGGTDGKNRAKLKNESR